MKCFENFKIRSLLPLLLLGLLASCGNEDSTLYVYQNGRQESLSVEGIDMVATGLGSALTPANQGYPAGNGIDILARFRMAGSQIADHLRITIRDSAAIYPGQQVINDGANTIVELQQNGLTQYVGPGSAVIVFRRGVVQGQVLEGQSVALELQITTPTGIIFGNLEGEVRFGY